MPATFHIYIPLHFYCSRHIDSTLLHISVTINKLQQYFTILLHNLCKKNYTLQIPEKWFVPKLHDIHLWGNMPIYMTHMKLLPYNDVARIMIHRQ